MKVGRIPRWPAYKTEDQNPPSAIFPGRLNGRVRTTNSATSNRTSPIQRGSLKPLDEVRSPVDSASTDEFVLTPEPAKVVLCESNFYLRRRRILSQSSAAAPPATATPSIASFKSNSGAAKLGPGCGLAKAKCETMSVANKIRSGRRMRDHFPFI